MKWLVSLSIVLVFATAATAQNPPPKPPDGNGMTTFAGAARKAGFIRITAKKWKLNAATNQWETESLDVTVPVAQGTNGVAIAGAAHTLVAQANNGSFAGNCTHNPNTNNLVWTGITGLDGDAGKIGVKVYFAVSEGVETTTPKGKKIKGEKINGGGTAGEFNIMAFGGTTSGGSTTLVQGIASVSFLATDSGGQIMIKIRDALTAEGWGVQYDPADPEALRIDTLPGGTTVNHLSIQVDYDDDEEDPLEYHWSVEYVDE